MSLKIKVNLEVNVTTGAHIFDIEDLGISEIEWLSMGESGQKELIKEAIHDISEQPYWMLDDFSETD